MSNIKQKIGYECKLLWMSSGTFANPTWTVVGAAKDVNTNVTREKIACLRRGSGEAFSRGGMKEFEIGFTLAYQPNDPASEAIRDAILNGTAIVLAAMTGLSTDSGAEGPKMKAEVMQFNRAEPLNGPVEIQCTANPNGEEDTTWLDVT